MKYIYIGGIFVLVFLLGAACNPVPYETGNNNGGAASRENSVGQPEMSDTSSTALDTTSTSRTSERATLENELRQAFVLKYGRPSDGVRIEIGLARDNTFVRGQVGFINPDESEVGEGGIFFSVRDSITGEWIIVHDGNGTIPCEPLELADFPRDMMGDCY